MRRALPFLLAFLAACDGGGEGVATPDQLRLVKVRGDGQTAPVAVRLPAGLNAAPGDLLPDPLVARIVISGPSAARGSGPMGPALVTLPSNTLVEYSTADPRCGRPFVATVFPDDSAYVSNRWEVGTLANTPCVMRVRLLVGGQPVQADSFTTTFAPGPAAGIGAEPGWTFASAAMPWSPPARFVQDAHGNTVPYRLEADAPLAVLSTDSTSAASRTIVIADTAEYTAERRDEQGRLVRLRIPVRVVAGGQVVATAVVIPQGGTRGDVEFVTTAIPFRAP